MRRFKAILTALLLCAGLSLGVSAAPAQAAPTSGTPSSAYPNPNPYTLNGQPWYCFQWSYGSAVGAYPTGYLKVWCKKGDAPGKVYASNGRWYGEFQETSCTAWERAKGLPACTARWKNPPVPTPL
jgi:hypothetical protein